MAIVTPLPLNPERPEPRNRRESLASIALILLESMTPETLLSLASDRDVPRWGQALAAEMAGALGLTTEAPAR